MMKMHINKLLLEAKANKDVLEAKKLNSLPDSTDEKVL